MRPLRPIQRPPNLFRKLTNRTQIQRSQWPKMQWSRRQSTKSPSTRVTQILSRLPPSLQKYTRRLRSAPLSHVIAFLILHELTAIIPLLGLFSIFHYTELVPLSSVMDRWGTYVDEGARRYERYFRKKGWFGFGNEEDGEGEGDEVQGEGEAVARWEGGDGRYRVVMEVALAYGVTKALLPVRIIGSVWATPWFAGVLGRAGRLFKR